MIAFPCTGCGCKLSVRRRVSGKPVKCPRCGSAAALPPGPLEPASLPPDTLVAPRTSPPPAGAESEAAPSGPQPTPPTVETDVSSASDLDAPATESQGCAELGTLGARLCGWLPPREAAALVEALARGVDAAGRQRILRRELRTDGEAPATVASPGAGQTADVYALGAILHECLLGRPPVSQTGKEEDSPRLRARAPRNLESICLKCLEKDPARSYATVQELADDLHRFLSGEPVRARPLGWFRSPAVLGLLAVSLLAGVAVGAVSWFFHTKLEEVRDSSEQAHRLAVKRAEQAETENRGAAQEAKKEREAREMAEQSEQQARTERDRALQAEQTAVEARATAQAQLARTRELSVQRTKDLLVGKWKTNSEKEKDATTEFTARGEVIATIKGGTTRGKYHLRDEVTIELQMDNPGAVKEQFSIKSLARDDLVLKDKAGKEQKAARVK
jgi:uncharacterized protein (TIGR03066 family)